MIKIFFLEKNKRSLDYLSHPLLNILSLGAQLRDNKVVSPILPIPPPPFNLNTLPPLKKKKSEKSKRLEVGNSAKLIRDQLRPDLY